MNIKLSSLNLNKSKLFLDYFHAAIKKKLNLPFSAPGSGLFTAEGYEAHIDDWCSTEDGGSISITWKIVQKHDGALIRIEANSNKDIPENQWSSSAQNFVNDILVSLVSDKVETFYRRRYFCAIYGSNLQGEYWIRGFRFAPQILDDDSTLVNAERYIVIDLKIEAIDENHANELADERADQIGAIISLLTDICLYKPIHEVRWVCLNENGKYTQKRYSTQHLDLDLPKTFPNKGDLGELGNYEGSVFDWEKSALTPFTLPVETRRIFRGYEASAPNIQNAFINCAYLYQLAGTIGRYHPTVKLAYECGAIDAMAQQIDGYDGFSDFVRDNIDEDVEQWLSFIHGDIRSAHWHGGSFAMGELDHRRDFLTNPVQHLNFQIQREAHRIMRTSIINWTMDKVAYSEK